ncbi:MAG: hypothetical protein ACOX3S_04320 [Anaerolineae bacterium]|jgi:hypothetical protein
MSANSTPAPPEPTPTPPGRGRRRAAQAAEAEHALRVVIDARKDVRRAVAVLLGLLAALIVVVILGITFATWLIQRVAGASSTMSLTLMLVIGVSALLAVLGGLVAIFAVLGLAQPGYSLGLPEGSVRAVIALALILIFSIQAVYLYGDLGGQQTYRSTGLTQAEYAALPPERIVAVTATGTGAARSYDVTLRPDKPEAAVDLAQQILTTVSTLVVAVAGFYFGTRSVLAAHGDRRGAEPLIRKVEPAQGAAGSDLALAIVGRGFGQAEAVRLARGDRVLNADNVMSGAERVTATLHLPADAEPGAWAVEVAFGDGARDRLDDAFTVTAAR